MKPAEFFHLTWYYGTQAAADATRWACRTSGKTSPWAAWGCVVGWVAAVAVIVIPSALQAFLYTGAVLVLVGVVVAWLVRGVLGP